MSYFFYYIQYCQLFKSGMSEIAIWEQKNGMEQGRMGR